MLTATLFPNEDYEQFATAYEDLPWFEKMARHDNREPMPAGSQVRRKRGYHRSWAGKRQRKINS